MPDKTIYRITVNVKSNVARFWRVVGDKTYTLYPSDRARIYRAAKHLYLRVSDRGILEYNREFTLD